MANIKFSQFTQKTTLGTVDFLVGYTGADNVQIDPADLLSDYSQGTGAAGQVTFFSAASTVTGDNNLYWDNTNKRLGVGTTSPTQKLDVDGAIITEDYRAASIFYLTSGGDWRFRTATGSERMRITSGGNVGIGTSSPSAKLHVNGTLIATGISQLGSGGSNVYLTSSSAGNVGIGTNSPGQKLEVYGTIKARTVANGAVGELKLGNLSNLLADNGDLSIRNNTTSLVKVTSAGNVGIGTTSPQENLEIHDATMSTISLSYEGNSGNGSSIDMNLRPASPIAAPLTSQILFADDGAYRQNIHFKTKTSATASSGLSTRMTIEPDGNVGIGTSSPSYKLDVRKNQAGYTYIASDNANTAASGTGSGFAMTEGGSVAWYLRNERDGSGKFNIGNSANRLTIDSSGNVGIGTTSPQRKLTIYESSGNAVLQLANNTSGAGASDGFLAYTDGVNVGLENKENGYLSLATNASEKMRIDAGGNVGIGTTSPSRKLAVSSSGVIADFISSITSSYIDIVGTTGQLRSGVFGGVAGIASGTGTTAHLAIDSSGNVGIGTTSPLGKLQVNEYIVGSQGNQTIHGELSVFANNGDESLYLGVKDAAYPNRGWAFNPVITGVNSDLQIKEHGQTGVRMTLQSQGNVGIGTTNPDSPLEVQFQETTGQSKVMMHLDYNPGDNYGSGLFRMSAGTNSTAVTEIEQVTSGGNGDFGTYNDTNIINRSLGSISSGNINFITGSNTSASSIVMRICGGPSKGRVGIGTSSPSEKLHVAGNINFGDSHFIGDDGNDNLLLQSSSGEAVIINGDTNVRLQDGGNTKLTTTSTGATVTGTLIAATGDLETSGVGYGLILKSPDGTRYRVTVANGGTLSVSAV